MKKLMRYKIISGRVVEKRDVLMEVTLDPTEINRPRGSRGKYGGKSKAAQIERNMRAAELELARTINCNFGPGDLFVSLKYNDQRLPASREEATQAANNFLRRLARAYRKETGQKLKRVLVTADRSSKTGQKIRVHHHLVLPAMAREVLVRNWPDDQMSIRYLDGRGDYSAIARYMIRNAGYQRGCRTWHPSQGLEKPIYTKPEPVKTGPGSFRVPRQAVVMERQVLEDGESGFHSAYIRYVTPAPASGLSGASGFGAGGGAGAGAKQNSARDGNSRGRWRTS